MEITRRQFLKLSGAGTAGLAMVGVMGKVKPAEAGLPRGKVLRGRETTTICPYDATGCGFIVTTENGHLLNIEGDPDHPINRGGACSKGASLAQLHNNPRRLSKVLYRRPNSGAWEEVTWDWALDTIAQRVKATRDSTFTERDEQGRVVNRAQALASLGGSALDSEECYAVVKAMRALGLPWIENQART